MSFDKSDLDTHITPLTDVLTNVLPTQVEFRDDALDVRLRLESLSLNDRFYQELDKSIWRDLTCYSPQIPINPTLHKVFVIPQSSMSEISQIGEKYMLPVERFKDMYGFQWPEMRCAVVFQSNRVFDAFLAHHEQNHGFAEFVQEDAYIGSPLGVQFKRRGFIEKVGGVQGGELGKVLEEGWVTYKSINYILGPFKREFPLEISDFVTGLKPFTKTRLGSSISDSSFLIGKLEECLTPKYKLSSDIFLQLLGGMRSFQGVTVTEQDIVASRFSSVAMTGFANKVDRVFGLETWEKLMHLPFSNREEDLSEIRKVIGLLKQKRFSTFAP